MRWLIGPFSFWFFGSLLLMTPQPGYLWYKHSASPRYHTVGRASGLLIGVRRSPYLWRRDILTDQQKLGDKAGDTYGLWWGTGTDHHLYPDPEEKSTLFKKLYKTLEKERSHCDGKEKVEDGENINAEKSFNKLREHKRHFEQQSRLAEDQDIEEQGLGENKLMVMEPAEIETSLEDKHFSVNDPALVKSSLRFNNLIVMEPRVKKRMLEETWLINNPGEQTGSLEQVKNMFTEPVYEARSFDKEMRDQLESDEDKELKVEQIQPMSLTRLLHRDSRDYLQLWRRHLARPKQSFYPRLKDSEWIIVKTWHGPLTRYCAKPDFTLVYGPGPKSSEAEDHGTSIS